MKRRIVQSYDIDQFDDERVDRYGRDRRDDRYASDNRRRPSDHYHANPDSRSNTPPKHYDNRRPERRERSREHSPS